MGIQICNKIDSCWSLSRTEIRGRNDKEITIAKCIYILIKINKERNSCHSTSWVNGHFLKLEKTIKETDEMTLTTTGLLMEVWESKIEDRTNPFDESIEQKWVRQWLFYTNSIKYASAMTGAPDYATFKNGWWYLSENLQQMKDWIELKKKAKGASNK